MAFSVIKNNLYFYLTKNGFVIDYLCDERNGEWTVGHRD